MPAFASFWQCSTIRCMTGMYGTAEISHVLLNCTFAMLATPAALARSQLRVARGPGPTTEMEYSPTVVRTPPRFTGAYHSLMLRTLLSFGSRGISFSDSASPQPQSYEITSAAALLRRIP